MPKYVGERLLLILAVFIATAYFLTSSDCPENIFRCDWNYTQYGSLGIIAVGILLLALLED